MHSLSNECFSDIIFYGTAYIPSLTTGPACPNIPVGAVAGALGFALNETIRRRRTTNLIRFARFDASDTASVPNANKAPTIKLWASQNGAPRRKSPFIRVVDVCKRARLPSELPVNANADGMPCHVTIERNDNIMRLAP